MDFVWLGILGCCLVIWQYHSVTRAETRQMQRLLAELQALRVLMETTLLTKADLERFTAERDRAPAEGTPHAQ